MPTAHDAATFSLEDVPVELANLLAHDIDTPGALAFLKPSQYPAAECPY